MIAITSKWSRTSSDYIQAIFNVMLKDFGVKGVKVQEVYGLDDASLAYLPCVIMSYIGRSTS